jgi:hypothetical protein
MRSLMKIELWSENSLPQDLLSKGLEFIHRRFLEVWGIYRSDVSNELVFKRKNLILTENSKIVGWLGIESDGELTNACIETGYKGTDNLINLIKKAYQVVPFSYIYANVPISKKASALAFLKTGMKLDEEPLLIKLKYPEKDVILVRLYLDKNKWNPELSNQNYIDAVLQKIEELNYDSGNLQIRERSISSQL